jgi:hypothetical protein
MDKAEFWATKSAQPVYETVTFSHPSFTAPFRIVANKFATVMLGGNAYTPAPMQITHPEQRGDGQAKQTITFPRAVVGREFKRQLKLIGGSRAPITITTGIWLGTELARSWVLYASDEGGVRFDTDAVQVVATIDNPMRRAIAPTYDPAVFTGLSIL